VRVRTKCFINVKKRTGNLDGFSLRHQHVLYTETKPDYQKLIDLINYF